MVLPSTGPSEKMEASVQVSWSLWCVNERQDLFFQSRFLLWLTISTFGETLQGVVWNGQLNECYLIFPYQNNVGGGWGQQGIFRDGGHWDLTCSHTWEVCIQYCITIQVLLDGVYWIWRAQSCIFLVVAPSGSLRGCDGLWVVYDHRGGSWGLFSASIGSDLAEWEGCQYLLSRERTFGPLGGPVWFSSRPD